MHKKRNFLGIDEAGRGSLIGPMIVAGILLDDKTIRELEKEGVKDSKQLTPLQRRELYKKILEKALWKKILIVEPIQIDENNLNRLTIKKMIEIVREASKSNPIHTAFLDKVGKSFKKKMKIGRKTVNIVMEEKADTKYIPVAAASIVAKVTRDNIIEEYRRKYGLKGSGYPSDPHTILWVKENLEKIPREIIRKKWKTLKRLGIISYRETQKKIDDYS